MNFIISFILGAVALTTLNVLAMHIYLKAYLKGFLDSHNKDITFLSSLPSTVKKIYEININE